MRGLGVRVGLGRERGGVVTTTKYYVLRHTPRGGSQRRESIGPTSDTSPRGWTLEAARAEAQKRIGRARDGIVEHRAAKVSALIDHYLENHVSRKKKRLAKDDRDAVRRLELVRREIGELPADQVSHVEVTRVLAGIKAHYESNRTRALIRNLYNEARVWGFVTALRPNPVDGTPVHRERVRDVRALKPGEVTRLLAAARKCENPWAGGAIALLALTGARLSEILGLRWADVDIAEATMTLRDRKAGDDLVLPLSDPALDVLKRLPKQQDAPWCFPAGRGGHLKDIREPWAFVLEAAELPKGTRLHDLRAALATTLALRGGEKLAQMALGHTDGRTTSRYLRPDIADVRKALQAHGRAVLPPAGARKRKKAAESS